MYSRNYHSIVNQLDFKFLKKMTQTLTQSEAYPLGLIQRYHPHLSSDTYSTILEIVIRFL